MKFSFNFVFGGIIENLNSVIIVHEIFGTGFGHRTWMSGNEFRVELIIQDQFYSMKNSVRVVISSRMWTSTEA